MNPQEKSEELINKFIKLVPEHFGGMDTELAKKCALICIQQIMNANPHSTPFNSKQVNTIIYWNEVRKEIS